MPANPDAAATLNSDQLRALESLEVVGNVFVTGVAGSGKSFLIRHFLKSRDAETFPVLASTGAAAILVGGRTFHSFFGLGILQGGVEATIERALKNSRLVRRLKKTEGVVIDEVSMISGQTLRAAEAIARLARGRSAAWGGLKIVAVGDFAQLPPVTAQGQDRDWAFGDIAWRRSRFRPAMLRQIMRTQDEAFLSVLNDVRVGQVTPAVRAFLDARRTAPPAGFAGTRLFARRDTTEQYNLRELAGLPGAESAFPTEYFGQERAVEDLKRQAPVPEVIRLKAGALVMLRQNDMQGRWVNGSLGRVERIAPERLRIALHAGFTIELEPANFTMLDAEGKEVASARNFPVNLAYATTIHKAQGMTLDQVVADLGNLWEPGQAYVALSRARTPEGLYLESWQPRSIRFDARVSEFYGRLERGEEEPFAETAGPLAGEAPARAASAPPARGPAAPAAERAPAAPAAPAIQEELYFEGFGFGPGNSR